MKYFNICRPMNILPTLMFCMSSTAIWAEEPVRANVFGAHSGGSVTYHYQLENNSGRSITEFLLGKSTLLGGISREIDAPLSVYPVGAVPTVDDENLTPGENTAPSLWDAFLQLDNSLKYFYSWRTKSGAIAAIRDGEKSDFSLKLTTDDSAGYDGFFSVMYGESKSPKYYTAELHKLDVSPPTVDIAINKDVLWPPNNKMTEIVVSSSVSDDYDPEPLVILESITSNETLQDGDIQDAAYGTSDLRFNLKATRNGNNKDGRVYVVTYLVKDGTGNSSRGVAKVIVPHDRR
ncbi:MAG: hypothetical protein OEZ43_21395 [Gammaproteobacteria bacterium]|nr:hypothetical protein [Gammaproteobacteria bacterium]